MGSFQIARPTVEPIQQPDVLSNLTRLQQYRSMQQEAQQRQQAAPYQQQLLEQQAQQGQIATQQAQQAQRDQQATSTSMQQWDGKNPDELPMLVIKNGGSANAVMGLKAKLLEMKQQASKIAADDATTGSKNVETITKKNDMVIGALSSLKDIPDEQLPQAVLSKAQELSQQGLLDPPHMQMAQQLAQQQPQLIRAGLDHMEKGMTSFSQALDQAKQQETARHDTAIEAQTAATAANTQAYQRARLGIEGGRLALERQKASMDANPSTATGADYLATLPPGVQAQVKAMANGDIAIPPAGTRNPQAQQLRTAVMTYDPTYTDARYKGKQQFKGSGDAQNIMQLATGMEHADRAITNSAAAGFAPALGNKTFESGPSAAYMQDVEFLTGEVGKLVKNGVLTVDESNKISSGLTSARQGIRDSALKETMDLLGGKTRALFQKYQNSTGQALPVNEFFDAKSQQRLQKYGLLEDGATGGGQSQGGNNFFTQHGGVAH